MLGLRKENQCAKGSVNILLLLTILISLLVLSVITGSISIASFEALIGATVGIVGTSFSFAFSIFTGIVKELSKQQEIKRKSTIKWLCYLEVN